VQIAGDFRVHAPASRVYAFFLDPVALLDCLDDPHEVHATDADHFEGTVTTGVAFIRGTFRLRGSYTGRTPEKEVRVRLQGSGLGSGIDADLVVEIAAQADGTSLHWSGDVRLSGPVATLGERIVKGTVDKKADGLFENARKKLEAA
jgi:uncharacterized protein